MFLELSVFPITRFDFHLVREFCWKVYESDIFRALILLPCFSYYQSKTHKRCKLRNVQEKNTFCPLSGSASGGLWVKLTKERSTGKKLCFFIDANIFMCKGASQKRGDNPKRQWDLRGCMPFSQGAINHGDVTRQRQGGVGCHRWWLWGGG